MALRDHVTLICLYIAVVAYCMIGAAIFHAVEYPREQADADAAVAAVTAFLANYTCVNASVLNTFLQDIEYLTSTGTELGTTPEPNMWSFTSAVTFALTVITTIGYGAQTPTAGGMQTFCVFYAMFGIPLCLTLLAIIGRGMATMNASMVDKLVRWPKEDPKRAVLGVVLLFIIGFILLALIPCIAFSYIEGWTYATSMYFTMVTLSTVGFGDYVTGTTVTHVVGVVFYRAFICIWIFIGLAWFASMLSIMADQMSSKVNAVMAINESKTDGQHDVIAINESKTGVQDDEHPKRESGIRSITP